MTKKETPKVELKLEKTEKNTEIKLNTDAIQKVEEEIANLRKELDKKEYLISKDISYTNALNDFVRLETTWKNTEALGVIELARKLEMVTSGKVKELSFDALALQAAYFFLGRKEGKGLESALAFKNLLKPVSDAIARMDGDKKKYEELQFRLSSLSEGIDPETSEELLKETDETPERFKQ